MSYDSVERHLAIEKLVTRVGSEGQEKKYYRVRPARWYGGIVTADCVARAITVRRNYSSVAISPANSPLFAAHPQLEKGKHGFLIVGAQRT